MSSTSRYNVAGVETEHGVIECDYFVNCSGIWAREIGKLSEPQVKVPICPAEHFFLSFRGDILHLFLPSLKVKSLMDFSSRTFALRSLKGANCICHMVVYHLKLFIMKPKLSILVILIKTC